MKRRKFIMFSTPRHAPFSEAKGINNKKNIFKKRTPKILSLFFFWLKSDTFSSVRISPAYTSERAPVSQK
jgi:hypothetical protein